MTEKRSKTTEKQQGGVTGKGFVKGDPRINRKGRPRTFDALRELAQQIAHETAKTKDGTPLKVNEKLVTVTEAILRQWATDKNRQEKFMWYAYGKVPDKIEIYDWREKVPPEQRELAESFFEQAVKEAEEKLGKG